MKRIKNYGINLAIILSFIIPFIVLLSATQTVAIQEGFWTFDNLSSSGLSLTIDDLDQRRDVTPFSKGSVVFSDVEVDADRNKIWDSVEAKAAENDTVSVIVWFDRNLNNALTYQNGTKGLETPRDIIDNYSLDISASWPLLLPDHCALTISSEELYKFAEEESVLVIYDIIEVDYCLDTATSYSNVDYMADIWDVTGDYFGGDDFYTKEDIVIAVIDTGIDINHPDLGDGDWGTPNKLIGWADFVPGGSNSIPTDHPIYREQSNPELPGYPGYWVYHGTHCSGIAAGTGAGDNSYTGVAPGAALVVAAVPEDLIYFVTGMEWVAENIDTYGIEIASMSFSSYSQYDPLEKAANNLVALGVHVVCANGNNGPNNEFIGSPCSASNVIAVGAIADPGEAGYWAGTEFSSRGPSDDGLIKPDICAPGYDITAPYKEGVSGYPSYGEQYCTMSGTSMSTPFVAGAIALYLSAWGDDIDPHIVKSVLKASAVDLGTAGPDNVYGAGRLDLEKFLNTPPPQPALKRFNDDFESNSSIDPHWNIHYTDKGLPLLFTAGQKYLGSLTWGTRSVLYANETDISTTSGNTICEFYYDLGENYDGNFDLTGSVGVYQPEGEISFARLAVWDSNWNVIAEGGIRDSDTGDIIGDKAFVYGQQAYLSSTSWSDVRADGVLIRRSGDTFSVYLDDDQNSNLQQSWYLRKSGTYTGSIRYVGIRFRQDDYYTEFSGVTWADDISFSIGKAEDFFDPFDDFALSANWEMNIIDSGIAQTFEEGYISHLGCNGLKMNEEGSGTETSRHALYYDLGENIGGEFTIEGVSGSYQPENEIAYVTVAVWDSSFDLIAEGGVYDAWSAHLKKDYARITNPQGEDWNFYQSYETTIRTDGVRIQRDGTTLTVALDTDQGADLNNNYVTKLQVTDTRQIRYVGFRFVQHDFYKDLESWCWAGDFRFFLHEAWDDYFSDSSIDWQWNIMESGSRIFATEGSTNTGNWGYRHVLRMNEQGFFGDVSSDYYLYMDLGGSYEGNFRVNAITGVYQPNKGEISYAQLCVWDDDWNLIAAGGVFDAWGSGHTKRHDAYVTGTTKYERLVYDTPNFADGVRIVRTGTTIQVKLDEDQDSTFSEYSTKKTGTYTGDIRYIGFRFFVHTYRREALYFSWVDNFKLVFNF